MNIFFKKTIKSELSYTGIFDQNYKKSKIQWMITYNRIFNMRSEQGKKNIREIYAILNNPNTKDVVRLKILILFHILIMNSNIHFEWISQNQITLNNPQEKEKQILNQQNPKKWLFEITLIYSKYLQKICTNPQFYLQLNLGEIKVQNIDQGIQKIYLTINLLNTIFPLKEHILNFGRYFFSKYQIIISLCKIITDDLSTIYNSYREILSKIQKNKKIQNFTEKQLKLYSNIIDETFSIHQSLYTFFYNRYYFDKINLKHINWFKFTNHEQKNLKVVMTERQKLDKSKKNKDYENFDISSFEDTYFSHNRLEDFLDQI